MKNNEQSAFPLSMDVVQSCGEKPNPFGLTKREYFSIKILAGLISDFDPEAKANGRFIPQPDHAELCNQAIQIADELLKQLANS